MNAATTIRLTDGRPDTWLLYRVHATEDPAALRWDAADYRDAADLIDEPELGFLADDLRAVANDMEAAAILIEADGLVSSSDPLAFAGQRSAASDGCDPSGAIPGGGVDPTPAGAPTGDDAACPPTSSTAASTVEAGVAPGGMPGASLRAPSDLDGGGSAREIQGHEPVAADAANGALSQTNENGPGCVPEAVSRNAVSPMHGPTA